MQGLADGYFIIPYTLGHYLAGVAAASLADHDERGVHDRRGRGRARGSTG